MPMTFDSLLYTYKEIGVVEKNGVKYKKLAKVPRLRQKHKAAFVRVLAVAVLAAASFRLLGWFFDRTSRPSEDRPPSQFQGFN